MIFQAIRFKGNARLSSAGDNSPVMKKGENGPAVVIVQQALIDRGFPMPGSVDAAGNPDGDYGKETKGIVWDFQIKHALPDKDGIVGGQTLSKLDDLFKITPGPTPPPPSPPPPPALSKIEQLLRFNLDRARRLVPAKIIPDGSVTADYIVRFAAAAVRVTESTQNRLRRVQLSADPEAEWNAGLERYWFGEYSERKFKKVQRTFDSIKKSLTNPRLVIKYRPKMDSYGKASPAILRIAIGDAWENPPPRYFPTIELQNAERVQTFVHEAAHIAGRTNGLTEGKKLRSHRLSFTCQ